MSYRAVTHASVLGAIHHSHPDSPGETFQAKQGSVTRHACYYHRLAAPAHIKLLVPEIGHIAAERTCRPTKTCDLCTETSRLGKAVIEEDAVRSTRQARHIRRVPCGPGHQGKGCQSNSTLQDISAVRHQIPPLFRTMLRRSITAESTVSEDDTRLSASQETTGRAYALSAALRSFAGAHCAGMVINGSFSLRAGFREREEEHDGRERALGLPVAVVNPEPVVAVTHGGKRVRRLVLAAVNPHRWLAAPRRGRFRRRAARCGPSDGPRARPDSWRRPP